LQTLTYTHTLALNFALIAIATDEPIPVGAIPKRQGSPNDSDDYGDKRQFFALLATTALPCVRVNVIQEMAPLPTPSDLRESSPTARHLLQSYKPSLEWFSSARCADAHQG
jgi:hypothetical protein